jgi:hypothetical protein
LRATVLGQRAASGERQIPSLSAAAGARRVLLLTGSLRDGTRLIGEDDLTVMGGQ